MFALLKTLIRKYILTGFLVLIPLFLTGWVLVTLFRITDNALALIPRAYRPETLIGFRIPGLGMVVSFFILFVLGAFVANVIGKKLLATGEKLLEKIPIVRWLYFSSKQLLEAVFAKEGDSFRRVVLIEYPRKGLYSVAFVTGESRGELGRKVPEPSLTVFIPTTPNPTSGFLYVVPEAETTPLSWTVEEAFRMVVSAGVILPGEEGNVPDPIRASEGRPQ